MFNNDYNRIPFKQEITRRFINVKVTVQEFWLQVLAISHTSQKFYFRSELLT